MTRGTRVRIDLGWSRVGLACGTLGTVVSVTETTVTVAWDSYEPSIGYGEGNRKPGETVDHPQWHVRDGIIEVAP